MPYVSEEGVRWMMPTLAENAVVGKAKLSWIGEQAAAGVAAVSVDEGGHPGI